jgi:hypothetical protein
MNKIVLSLALSLVACSALAAGGPRSGGTSGSTVNFDANTGKGFIAARVLSGYDPTAVTFSYKLVSNYTAECTWSNHTRTRYPLTQSVGYVVNSQMDISGSRHTYSGFRLTGFGSYVQTGDTIPTLGTICQKGQGGTWTDVSLTGSQGGLYWNYGADSTLIQ